MPTKTEINELKEKDFLIYPYTHHLHPRHVDLVIVYGLFILFTAYWLLENRITFNQALWMFISASCFLIPLRLALHFIYPMFSHGQIVLTDKELTSVDKGVISETYSLHSIAHFHLQVTQENGKGLQRIKPLHELLRLMIIGDLYLWLSRKNNI
jgi:hypothetical protein